MYIYHALINALGIVNNHTTVQLYDKADVWGAQAAYHLKQEP